MRLNDAHSLALYLMAEHNLQHWTFSFDNAKRRFGVCYKSKRKISLSRYFVEHNDVEDVTDTILHEIAHALCNERGHGPAWKATARRVGAKPERCYDETINTPPARWKVVCNSCGWSTSRHRRTRTQAACPHCCASYNNGKYDVQYKLVWKENH